RRARGSWPRRPSGRGMRRAATSGPGSRPMASANAFRAGFSAWPSTLRAPMLPSASVENPWTRPGWPASPAMRSTAAAAPASVDDRRIPTAIGAAVDPGHRLELLAELGKSARCGYHVHDRSQNPGAVWRGPHRAAEAFLAQQVARPARGTLGIEHQEASDRVGHVEPRSLLSQLFEALQVLLVRGVPALAWRLAVDRGQ